MSARSRWVAWDTYVRVPRLWLVDRVGRVSPRAILVDLAAWGASADDLTDGRLADADVLRVCQRAGCARRDQRERVVGELVREGFWEPADDGGFRLSGFLEWNVSRAAMEARREAYRRRTATLRRRRAERAVAEREAHL